MTHPSQGGGSMSNEVGSVKMLHKWSNLDHVRYGLLSSSPG